MINKLFSDLDPILEKLADLTRLFGPKRDTFYSDVHSGLLLNIIAEGKDLLSPELSKKMFSVKINFELAEEILNELSSKPEGVVIIDKEKSVLVSSLVNPVLESLSDDQKIELYTLINDGIV